MTAAPAHPDPGGASLPEPDRRWRWLRADEGWAPGEEVVRLLGAVAVGLAATALKVLIVAGLGGELGYLGYVGAVALAAWFAGWRGGVITTSICAIAEAALFSGTLSQFLAQPLVVFRFVLFLFVGLLVAWITSHLRQAMVHERSARALGEARLEAQVAAYRAAERDRAALAGLQAVTASLAGAATPAEVADAILDRGLMALGARAGGVSRISDDGAALELLAVRGYPDEAVAGRRRFDLAVPSHLSDAVRSRAPLFLTDPVAWAQRYPASAPAPLDDSPTGGALAVLPLVLGGQVIGTAVFRFLEPSGLDAGTRDLALRLADQGAQALDRALAYDRERTAREALERSGAAVTRFKATVDVTDDAVYMFDPDTLRLTYVNRGGGTLVGRDAAGLLGAAVLGLQPASHEAAFRLRMDEVRASPGRSLPFTGVLVHRDGREVPVDARLQEVTLPDGARTAILTARDISDRIDVQARLARIAGDERRKAAELRAVIGAMGEGVLVVDPGGAISLANNAASTILGGDVPPALAALEDRFLPAAPPDAADRSADGASAADAGARPRTVRLDDGRWLEVTVYRADLGGAVGDENGASRIVVLRDVTRAREAEAAREAFIGVLSHELRTPVTTIFGWAKILQRPGRRPGRAEMLADIEIEADRLYRIVEDLLALSRVEGGIRVEGEPLLVQHLAGSLVAAEARRSGDTRFEIELPADLPAVFGERTYVEQVLRNLVSNAVKYSPAGSVVTIRGEATPTEVLVRVLDRGRGIEPAEADRLFELYYRSSSTARMADGAGIGLYIGRGLVTAMGGRVWALPRAGGGSEFGFSLQRCDDNSPAPAGAALADPSTHR